jgi:aryl-alcohol dehydrogenase-like predicted oxidoreductase
MSTTAMIPTRRLGRTGLEVTELGLGCYMFTGEFSVPRPEAEAILGLAFASGINYADTAQMYGFGEGEELVARALRRHHPRQLQSRLARPHRGAQPGRRGLPQRRGPVPGRQA